MGKGWWWKKGRKGGREGEKEGDTVQQSPWSQDSCISLLVQGLATPGLPAGGSEGGIQSINMGAESPGRGWLTGEVSAGQAGDLNSSPSPLAWLYWSVPTIPDRLLDNSLKISVCDLGRSASALYTHEHTCAHTHTDSYTQVTCAHNTPKNITLTVMDTNFTVNAVIMLPGFSRVRMLHVSCSSASMEEHLGSFSR